MAENYTLPCSWQGGWAGGFNWSLFGLLYVWGVFALYDCDEDMETKFRGESRGFEVLDDAWRIISVIWAGSSRETLITPNFQQISDVRIYSCVWFQCPAVEDLKCSTCLLNDLAVLSSLISFHCNEWLIYTVSCFCFGMTMCSSCRSPLQFIQFFFFHCTIPN